MNFKNLLKKTILTTCILLSIVEVKGQCDTTDQAYKDITVKYQGRLKSIEDEGNSIETGGGISGTIKDIRLEETKMVFDLVSVTMKDKRISLKVPQVTMKLKKISFNKPVVVMVNRVVGKYPEVTMGGWCKCEVRIKWKDIITKVPETRMERQEISTKIPEFKNETTNFITKIPLIKKDRKTMIFKVPKITVQTASDQAKDLEKKGKELEEKANSINNEQQMAFSKVTVEKFACQRTSLISSKDSITKVFDESIIDIDHAIKSVASVSGDPTKIDDGNGGVINLIKMREDLMLARDSAIAEVLKAIDKLNEEEKAVLFKMGAEEETVTASSHN